MAGVRVARKEVRVHLELDEAEFWVVHAVMDDKTSTEVMEIAEWHDPEGAVLAYESVSAALNGAAGDI